MQAVQHGAGNATPDNDPEEECGEVWRAAGVQNLLNLRF